SKTFGAKTDLTSPGANAGIAIADMNGDGRPDIVTANGNHNSISIFKNGAPGIVSFSPESATTGQTVTILGNGLQNTTGVSFGGVPALSFTLVSPSEIRAVVGAGQSGNVVVTAAQGTYSMAGFQFMAPGNKLYVHADVSSPGSGQNWANALPTLSEAIVMANLTPGIDSILVAAGTYYPTGAQSLTNRDSALIIDRGNLNILGGFDAATGNRNIRLHETIISGNIGNAGSKTDNSYHLFVVTAAGQQKITIDGFTLRDGFAHPFGTFVYRGKTVQRNLGSMLYSDVDIPIAIMNCKVTKNETSGSGAIYVNHGSLMVKHNMFTENISSMGGAIFSHGNNQLLAEANVFFRNNVNGEGGGAIFSLKNQSTKDTILNNVFAENHITDGTGLRSGGALYLKNGQHHIVNNTFYNNTSMQQGGAIFINGEGTYGVYNNIFSKNKGQSDIDVGIIGINANYLQSNNSFSNTNPSFTNIGDLDGPDNVWGTLDDGLRIDVGSLAFNTGDISKIPVTTINDAGQTPRVMFNGLDVGAYEGLQTAIQCPGSSFQYQINSVGQTYHWEINQGSGYQTIAESSIFSGASNNVLSLNQVPGGMAWANIRGYSVNNGVKQYEPVRTITFSTVWNGNSAGWHQAGNWSCGVPSSVQAVIIPLNVPHQPMVSSDAQAGGLILFPSATLLLSPDAKLEIKK
nr:IPT/TIG domain-containing protein [Chitinophagaceae bacterium]